MPFSDPDLLTTDLVAALLVAVVFAPVVIYLKRRKGLLIVGRLLLAFCAMLGMMFLLQPRVPMWALAVFWLGMWHLLELSLPMVLSGLERQKRLVSAGAGGIEATSDQKLAANMRGRVGIALTDLKPSGRIEIDGQPFDAIADGEFIHLGESVSVEGASMGCLKVSRRRTSSSGTTDRKGKGGDADE